MPRFSVCVLACFIVGSAQAHHSYAMFDKQQYRELEGTVKSYSRVNPHGYLDLLVTTKSGKVQTWSIESPSVSVMQKFKITNSTFKPGDKVKVTIHPLRDGTTGGDFVQCVLADGTILGPIEHGNL